MRTFEEWMAYQAVDIASLSDDEIKAWRSAYDKSREAQYQQRIWTPRVRANAKDLLYAVAVRDVSDLWLALWVKRSARCEYFVMFPRDKPGWDPHASYHRDGRLHQKSHDQKMLVSQRQIPGPGFKGTEQMLTTTLDLESVCAVKALCDPAQFTGVLEISGGILHQGGHTVAVDLTEANGSALAQPWSQIVMQKRFSEAIPEVLLTVWRHDRGA
jgi:hypothetical protein